MIVGSGIDLIEIARVERALARRGDRFLRRVFAPAEIAACGSRGCAAAHFAVRFAAKEAVMKALRTGASRGVRWVDIETLPLDPSAGGSISGRLRLKLHGRVDEMASEMGALRTQLAVTRSRTHALAVVLLERPSS